MMELVRGVGGVEYGQTIQRIKLRELSAQSNGQKRPRLSRSRHASMAGDNDGINSDTPCTRPLSFIFRRQMASQLYYTEFRFCPKLQKETPLDTPVHRFLPILTSRLPINHAAKNTPNMDTAIVIGLRNPAVHGYSYVTISDPPSLHSSIALLAASTIVGRPIVSMKDLCVVI
jgi:hypothetical protein